MGLGENLSPKNAADVAWAHLSDAAKAVYSEADFDKIIIDALSGGYQVTRNASGNTIDDDVIVNAAFPGATFLNPKPAFLRAMLSSMRQDGYYIVSTQSAQVQTAPQATAQSDSIAYRGAIAAQQAGSPSSQTQAQPAAVSAASSTSPVQIQPRQSRATIYKRVPYKQTAAEKQRLIWIIGGFGVLFAIAIGVIAARD